jgi:hypothetical protein
LEKLFNRLEITIIETFIYLQKQGEISKMPKTNPNESKSKFIERLSLCGLKVKEETDNTYLVEGLIATTHPDRVGDILSKNALTEIVNYVNRTDSAGGDKGAYRSVSLFHDWIHENDPTLDEAGFLKPSAELVELDDGHYGVKVLAEINKYYRGDMKPDEIKYRIDNGQIAGFSIEYNTDSKHSKDINYNGEKYRFIDGLTEFGGVGFARARMIANPYAVIYKEIENNVQQIGVDKMAEEKVEPLPEIKEQVAVAPEVKVEVKESGVEQKEAAKIDVKEILESKEFKEAVNEVLEIKSKVIKTTKEDVIQMEQKETVSLSVKEMKESLSKGDILSFKEASSKYFREHPEIEMQLKSTGIPLKTTMQVKCNGSKLQIVGGLETKDTLDTSTNSSTYTQNIVEFADVYLPTIIDTFNNQTTLFGRLRKVDNIQGGNKYGWRITTDQSSSLAVDPDINSVDKDPVKKLKLQTDMKEYRIGVSVSDYTLYHSRAAIGDLFMIEVEKRMRDLMKDLNKDLFDQQTDNGLPIMGLGVANSASVTTMYGLTRSTANRLAPDAAADTYLALSYGVTVTAVRAGVQKVEIEGASRGSLRLVVNPKQRDAIFNLEDTKIRYMNEPRLGFFGDPSLDGIPMIVDSDCPNDSVFVIDDETTYLVISKAPQLVGLAKVGAAEEAYISTYLALVLEQPRRIYWLDTLS